MSLNPRILAGFLFVSLVTVIEAEPLVGFDDETSKTQRRLEEQFDQNLSPVSQDEWLAEFSARPHHAGSSANRQVAARIEALFSAWGFDTSIVEYDILLPTPKTRALELVAPVHYTASLSEDSLPEDPSTAVRKDLLAPYNAFSKDGDVEGELVFINYGRPEDHRLLKRYGISLKGKIAIAKYGKSWRGIKPKLAAENGAIGTIIYSDPADDGYGAGDVYPVGPFKHASGVQRGSVMDMPTYPGDVLTPGRGATPGARRLKISDAPTITQIPVLPISYRDALPLLQAMGGATVPDEWVGGLPITYHLGPGPARVHLKLEFNWDRITIYNVVARLEGEKYPDEWVIRGNHYDGWNHGAADPLSGMVALLDEARSVARLASNGSRPARTIVYAAWDAEEPGLIGSTEWAEDNAKILKERAVAYLNTDGNSRGFLNIGGSHTLEKFFNQVSADVDDPQTGATLKARARAAITLFGSPEARKNIENRTDLRLSPLGSGSDYTPFLQHLGIASANLSFSGEGTGGSYHTLYDTYEHYTRFRDPKLAYGVALARVAGRATLRLANAPILPFEFASFVDNVALYIDEIVKLADTMRTQTSLANQQINEGLYKLALDPTKTLNAPDIEKEVPHFNFAPLQNSLLALQKAIAAAAPQPLKELNSDARRELNRLLYTSERRLTLEAGLTGRSWYKHHIYAPGFYTGYGVKTIPGVREAIETRDFDAVDKQIVIAAKVLEAMTIQVGKIASITGSPGRVD